MSPTSSAGQSERDRRAEKDKQARILSRPRLTTQPRIFIPDLAHRSKRVIPDHLPKPVIRSPPARHMAAVVNTFRGGTARSHVDANWQEALQAFSARHSRAIARDNGVKLTFRELPR